MARRSGAVQEQLARAFQCHLAELGFHVGHELLTDRARAGLFWWRQVQWLKGGDVNALALDPARVALGKTGRPAYPAWGRPPLPGGAGAGT